MNTSTIQIQQFSYRCWFPFRQVGKCQQLICTSTIIQSNHTVHTKKYKENHSLRNGRDTNVLQKQRRQQHHIYFSSFSHTTIPVIAAVKELSWCASKESRTNKNNNSTKNDIHKNHQDDDDLFEMKSTTTTTTTSPSLPIIIQQFGIIAAMERTSRIIGINGKLPWNIPEDRLYFKQLTNNKILIIGKKTLYEILHGTNDCNKNNTTINPLVHINHAKHCIVVSTTVTIDMIQKDFLLKSTTVSSQSEKSNNNPFIHIATTFTEALQIANQLVQIPVIQSRVIEETNNNAPTDSSLLDENDNNSQNKTKEKDVVIVDDGDDNLSDSIQCWIAGGQRLYEEAIKHPSCKILHLTIVDTIPKDNDYRKNISTSSYQEVAKFPPNYRWDNLYTLCNKNSPIKTSLLTADAATTTTTKTAAAATSGSTTGTTTINNSCTTNDNNNTNSTIINYCHMVYYRKQRGNK